MSKKAITIVTVILLLQSASIAEQVLSFVDAACIVMGGRSVGVLDFDGDGLLDLLVTEDKWTGGLTRLFRNLGKLRFDDASNSAGLPNYLPGLGVITPDLNQDGWPDIFVSQANRLFLSNGNGTIRKTTVRANSQYGKSRLRVKLIKIGAKVIRHSRYVIFQMAEVLVSKRLFQGILERIHRLKPVPIGYG